MYSIMPCFTDAGKERDIEKIVLGDLNLVFCLNG